MRLTVSILLAPMMNENGKKCLFTNKVSVIGVGQVGMACATAIAASGCVKTIALNDVVPQKVAGEVMDMAQALPFLQTTDPPHVVGSSDLAVTAGSDLIVVSCGVRQRVGESRLSLVERNIAIFETLIPALVKASPDTTLLIVTNPVDIMTLVAYNLAGLPRSRVLGSGTMLDSGRFRSFLADAFQVNVKSVGGFVVGEHGDTSVALLSSVTIGGVPWRKLLPSTKTTHACTVLDGLQDKVRDSARTVIAAKGYTNIAIGQCVALLAHAILMNTDTVHTVSVSVRGLLPGRPEAQGGVATPDDLYLSLPCLINGTGVAAVLAPALYAGDSAEEQAEAAALHRSAEALLQVVRGVTLPPPPLPRGAGDDDALPVYSVRLFDT